MSDLIGFAFYISCIVCWFKAILTDIASSNLMWTLIDFFIVPVGAIRGLILFIS